MKHLALAVAFVWLVVMAWIAAWLLAPAPPVPPVPAAAASGSAVAQLTAALDRGGQTLDVLAGQSAHRLAGPEPVIALPPAPTAAGAGADSALAALAQATEAGRTLSMVYTAAGFQRAVIDGQYVAPGQRLADGARIDTIAADHVVLRDRHGRQVLRLAPPHPARNGQLPGPDSRAGAWP